MNTKMAIVLTLGLIWTSGLCRADSSPELASQFEEQLTTIDQAVGNSDSSSSMPADIAQGDESWYLKNFWLRTKFPVGFVVPGFATVTVVPEAEFLWQRQTPEGWTPYKP